MTIPARRRRVRLLLSTLSAALMLVLATQGVLASVRWTSPVRSSPSSSYNAGQGLARTVSTVSGATYLHAQYTYLDTANPGVYYRRGNADASSWGTPKRLNPTGEFAENGVIAASDRFVYLAYQRIGSWDHYRPSDPRPLRLRVNTNHGSSSAWLPTKSFSVPARAGHPAIAAAGRYAYLAYTDAATGDIVVASNGGANTADAGWTARTVGTTVNDAVNPDDGKDGYPVVAATGSTVLVAWISGDGATISAVVSTDLGRTWPTVATTITTSRVWDLSAGATTGRLGLAWDQANGVRARLYRNGAWGGTKTVATFSSTGTDKSGYGTSIALSGTGRVGVAWSSCTRSTCTAGSTSGVNVRWRESIDNMTSWKGATTIASYTASASRRVNDYPTALMSGAPTRWVMYNVANASITSVSTMVEVGRGTP